MADERIPIRLVPRNRGRLNQLEATPSLREESPQLFSVDPGLALEALNQLKQWAPDASLSPYQRIDATIGLDEAAARFSLDLSKVKTEAGRVDPDQMLSVPADLEDAVEYAYVPTPFEYHAERRVSPPSQLYHLKLDDVARALNAIRCHRRNWTGRDVIVATADSGFALHPHHELGGFAIRRRPFLNSGEPSRDFDGHGTACIADLFAIAPDCTLEAVKNVAERVHAAAALEHCLSFNPRVMVNSWGFPWDAPGTAPFSPTDPRRLEAIDIENVIAQAPNVAVVFSAGNDGKKCFPASLPNVIAVGGVTVEEDGELVASTTASSFSSLLYPERVVPDICGVVGEAGSGANQQGPRGHIMHPVPLGSQWDGENLPQHKGKGWAIFSGTSAAAPQIAGVIALMIGISPSLTPPQVKRILQETARDVTTGMTSTGDLAGLGQDRATGAGLVDALACCELAERLGAAWDF